MTPGIYNGHGWCVRYLDWVKETGTIDYIGY